MLQMLIGPVTELLGKVIPDVNERNKLAHEIATLAEKQAHEQIQAQLKLNTVEASHKSVFVSGWRPFIGWTCGAAMAFNFIGIPLGEYAIAITGSTISPPEPLELEVMMPVLLGMLGLGGMRSYEKRNGVAGYSLRQGSK